MLYVQYVSSINNTVPRQLSEGMLQARFTTFIFTEEPRPLGGTQLRSWLRHYAASWKVAGLFPHQVIGFSIDKSFQLHYGPGVDSLTQLSTGIFWG
jgi:hypothetical protein